MKKRAMALALCVIMLFALLPTATLAAYSRDTSYEETLAYKLKELGLFLGVSDTEFELNRAPTRIEALIMLIRVMGKEADALTGNYSHPFTDVPNWANQYVGYAYENGLTNGSSATKFGTEDATAAQYLTFVLRALGYSDTNNEDFRWDNPFALAESVGILPAGTNITNFWRADVVLVSYAALSANLKGTKTTLAQKMIDAGVFRKQKYEDVLAGVTGKNSKTAEAFNYLVKFIQENENSRNYRYDSVNGDAAFKVESDGELFLLIYDRQDKIVEVYFDVEISSKEWVDTSLLLTEYSGEYSFIYECVDEKNGDLDIASEGIGWLNPATFTESTILKFDDYYGKGQSDSEKAVSKMVAGELEILNEILKYAGSKYTVRDFGFTSFNGLS